MQQKKRLFAVRHTTSGKTSGAFFSSKKEAKDERDRLNSNQPGEPQYVVTVGPDHQRYKQH